MGSLKAWLQGATIRNTKPGKIQHFGGNFNSYVNLEESVMIPYGKLCGKLILDSSFHPKTTGWRVQLEAECILRLTTVGKNGHRMVHRKKVCILEKTVIDDKGDLVSPIRDDMLPPTESHKVYVLPLSRNGHNSTSHCTTGGCYREFSLPIPGDTLPAPFKNPYGSLVYKVVGYLRSYYCRYVPVGEQTVQYGGYHNLSQNPRALKPINIERPFNSTSDGLQVIANLSTQSSGFLPGEELPFLLIVECSRCVPIVMKVFLSQKITYNVDGVVKNMFTTIDTKQKEDAIEITQDEIIWQDSLTLPLGLDPSYNSHPAYIVKYAIRFKLHIGNQGTLEGVAPVYVGTTREPVEAVMISGTASTVVEPPSDERLDEGGPNSSNGRSRRARERRSGSPVSVRSDNSVSVSRKMSLPTYSQLSSRAVSLETLPPAYDEVVLESDSE